MNSFLLNTVGGIILAPLKLLGKSLASLWFFFLQDIDGNKAREIKEQHLYVMAKSFPLHGDRQL